MKIIQYIAGALAVSCVVAIFNTLLDMDVGASMAIGLIAGLLYGLWYIDCYGNPFDNV